MHKKIQYYWRFKKGQYHIRQSIKCVLDIRSQRSRIRHIKPVYFYGSYNLSAFKIGGIYPLEALKMLKVKAYSGWHVPPEDLKNSILIFVKHGIPVNIKKIKDNGNKIIVDMQDNFIESDGALNPDFVGRDVADYLLFPNQVLLDKFLSIKPTTSKCLVYYGFCDPAIALISKRNKKLPSQGLKCCYFGFKLNLSLDKISQAEKIFKVNMIPLTEYNFNHLVNQLPQYNLHIDLRSVNNDSLYKPLMKILIAAECRSNILIERTPRVLEILPKDYPYLIDHSDLESAMRCAKETYGTPVWDKALEIMADVREKYSFNNYMQGFIELLNSLS